MKRHQNHCPCGSGSELENCCLPYIKGQSSAADAETLMRSRYVAYCLDDEQYLLATWHASTRPASVKTDAKIKWIRLKVIDTDIQQNQVEFVATYRLNGKAHKLKERSRFVVEEGTWFYLDALDSGT